MRLKGRITTIYLKPDSPLYPPYMVKKGGGEGKVKKTQQIADENIKKYGLLS